MKKIEKRNWIIEKLGINNLTEDDIVKLVEYDNKLLKYTDINKMITNGNTKAICKCIEKTNKIISKINVYNKDILKAIIFSKNTKYDDILDYINICNFNPEQRITLNTLLIEYVENSITSNSTRLSKKQANKVATIMRHSKAIMPKFNYDPMTVKIPTNPLFVQLYINGDEYKKQILVRRYSNKLNYKTMVEIGLAKDIILEVL